MFEEKYLQFEHLKFENATIGYNSNGSNEAFLAALTLEEKRVASYALFSHFEGVQYVYTRENGNTTANIEKIKKSFFLTQKVKKRKKL